MRILPALALAVATALAQPPGDAGVGIDMRNVRLHVSDDTVLEVAWLHGRLRPTKAGETPVFDNQQSFSMEIEDGEIAIDASGLTVLLNRAVDYQVSALNNLTQSSQH